MTKESLKLDQLDFKLLEILQENCRIPIKKLAKQLGVPKSTVHYRIKRLEAEKIITGWSVRLDSQKLGKRFTSITFVRGKYGPDYHKKIGEKLAQIPGVVGVYFVFGDNDFVVLTLSDDREDFIQKLEIMYNMTDIERTSSLIVGKTIKEDPTIEFTSSVSRNESQNWLPNARALRA